MASPVADGGRSHEHPSLCGPAADSAFLEAQKWIEAVTGRCFGDRDFRGGLENGILLCELLSSIKPGLVKKINRLPTPIAGLDNLSVFLRGCEELGLKGSQLFDPGDLQDASTRPNTKVTDCSRKLKNVLITIYWLGRAANSCTSYNGPTLDLKEFEGLLSQMQKEAEEAESPKRSIRDSGYIDCWESERSDSLSPPHHGREDSFDSLDSFGSRSRQTPSPDVLVARGSSDGRGSDSESDAPPYRKLPDVHKDDMLARRTSVSEPRAAMPFNQYLPNKSNQSGYVPMPLRKKRSDKEDGGRKSWSTATSPIGRDRPFSSIPARSSSVELFHRPSTLSTSAATTPTAGASPLSPAAGMSQKLDDEGAALRKGGAGNMSSTSGADRDDTRARRALTSPRRSTATTDAVAPSPTHFLPVPAAAVSGAGCRGKSASDDTGRQMAAGMSDNRDVRRRQSGLDDDHLAIYSHTAHVSDQPQSVSMIDMRGEEEAGLQPHSQVRHELMHNQYNRMREEDNHWQDDLARWKNRRRSVSQDLIKKEEERKMMERLMTGDGCTSSRRKSIKTYREIVEEKERREEELRDAYRNARSADEASAVLQSYAQRFSISEAVLERLQLPRLLDRSMSSDPTFPPSLSSSSPSHLALSTSASPSAAEPLAMDPDGPLRYLRQQSAPVPRFTSTVEARVEDFAASPSPSSSQQHQPQIRSRSSEPPTARALSPKPVPLLTPKPYVQSQTGKADSLLRVNGEVQSNDISASPESRDGASPPHRQASPSKPLPAAANDANEPLSTDSPAHSTHNSPVGRTLSSATERAAETKSEDAKEESAPPTRPTSLPTELQRGGEGPSVIHPKEEEEEEAETAALQTPPAEPRYAPQGQVEPTTPNLPLAKLDQSEAVPQQGQPKTPQVVSGSRQEEWSQSKDSGPVSSDPESLGSDMLCQTATGEAEKDHQGNVSEPVLPQAKRADRWSWDPDEERKRQQRWQQEQERMLQEKYHREQAKLKEEWERAQKEVAEEERKYHEEERRILEETVTPLTPHSPFPPSPLRGELSSSTEAAAPLVLSLADWERKQELLERQSRGSTESVEWKRREADRTSDISTADDSMKTGRSVLSQPSSQAETPCQALQNGQQVLLATAKTQTPPQTQAPPKTQATPPAKAPAKKQQELSLDCTKPSRPAGDRRCGPIDNKIGPSKPLSPCPTTRHHRRPRPTDFPPVPSMMKYDQNGVPGRF
ncbi:LIM and calponin homology domains-containing protein 1-like [Lampris incognitus]|uniref:LIM and calponin homology domains-containing protein 1-like n=1 Tax=Lampris incognitus TaxID=2546036 RepID=UPI0024B4B286|nr:LIM and calponin homology domains-containing protein 1-like [Lampris incognitus]